MLLSKAVNFSVLKDMLKIIQWLVTIGWVDLPFCIMQLCSGMDHVIGNNVALIIKRQLYKGILGK